MQYIKYKKNIKKNKFQISSEINMIPMLDILLVLLIIMITAMPSMHQNIELNLPNIKEQKKSKHKNDFQVIIEVLGVEQYNIVVGNNRIEKLKLYDLMEKIMFYTKNNSETFFLIAGNKDVPYNEIVKTLNILHIKGIKSVGLMTKVI